VVFRVPYRERTSTSLWNRLVLSGRLGGVVNVVLGSVLILAILVPYLADRVGLIHLSLVGSDLKEEVRHPPDWGWLAAWLDRVPSDQDRTGPTGPGGFPFERRTTEPEAARVSHPLGTDTSGRDMLQTVLLAADNAFLPGLYSVVLAVGLGILFGIGWGYYGGWRGSVVQSIIKVVHAIPRLFLLLIVAGRSNFSIYWIMTGLGVINFPKIAELIRARILQLQRQEFITAAREVGMRDLTILVKHILWYNCRHVLFIQASFGMADAVLTETTLSYLDFGAHGEIPSWGQMVAWGKNYLFVGQLWLCVVPALAIVMVILGFCLLGDGLSRLFKLKVT
jgi:peptide/nickel transport system permease protein